ncbi:MAG TPA: hypothetical protein VMV86_06695 [Methanosarcinales archaeon]|nr:hypothetical protein [Methanosarcinales archaeon]
MSIIPQELKEEAIRTCFKTMFRKGYFCIIDFKQCAELADVLVPHEILTFLSPLHCVYFNTMKKSLVSAIKECITLTFSQENMNLGFVDGIKLQYAKDAKFEDAEEEININVQPDKGDIKLIKLLESI